MKDNSSKAASSLSLSHQDVFKARRTYTFEKQTKDWTQPPTDNGSNNKQWINNCYNRTTALELAQLKPMRG